MNQPVFQGCATALITPFLQEGNCVDYGFFETLLEFQLENGSGALVIAGTTGEAPTLTPEEKRRLFRLAVSHGKNRAPVIAGTGSNNTQEAVRKSNAAEKEGVDGLLIVTPYYNKCTQDGLIRHYTYIADRVSTPIIVYNVPSRTGINVKPETYAALAEHPRIAGIKEANGDISAAAKTIAACGDRCCVYTGNDDQTLAFMALGAKGVISVAANLIPAETNRLCELARDGELEAARTLQETYLKLTGLLFCEVNPIPVKAAVGMMFGRPQPLRLPLTGLTKANREKLLAEMKGLSLVK